MDVTNETEEKKEITVKQLLEEWVIQNQEASKLKHKPLKDNEFYASSAGMCPRVMYFDKKYGRKEPGMKVQKIFVLGNLVHDFVQEKLFKAGESESPAILAMNGIVVRGRLDHLDDEFIWELKSIANIKYVQYKPKIENVYQIMIYLKAIGRLKGKLVYVEKNTFDVVEHKVDFDELANRLASYLDDEKASYEAYEKCKIQ